METHFGRASDIKDYYLELHGEHGIIEQRRIKLREYELEEVIDKIYEISKAYRKK